MNLFFGHDQFTPIPTIIPDPPYIAFHFYSDAAGPTHTLRLSGHHFVTTVDPGAANIGFLPASFSHLPHNAFFSSVLTWPLPFLTFAPAHSTLAEFLALLLPFLGLKQKLPGHMIVLHVDNMACVDLWASRVCKHDEMLAICLQILHVLEAALECRVFLVHSPRRSSPATCLVDNLTRASTTTPQDRMVFAHTIRYFPRGPLLDWLFNPMVDWGLPKAVAQYVLSTND